MVDEQKPKIEETKKEAAPIDLIKKAEADCTQEIGAVLNKYKCRFWVEMILSERGAMPNIQVRYIGA